MAQSWTGEILYSDTYVCLGLGQNRLQESLYKKKSVLNVLEAIPIIGIIGGIIRCALAIIHIIGHALAALIFRNKGHLYHTAKGVTEFLRSLITITPFVGRIFVWKFDTFSPFTWPQYNLKPPKAELRYAFFLIKIYDPEAPDFIDQYHINPARFRLF